MPSPIVHSQQGLVKASLLIKILLPALAGLGLGWLLPVIAWVVGYICHLPLDCVPHVDTVAGGSQEEYDQSMAWDPKDRVHDRGLEPIWTRGGREKLALTEPDLAYPNPVTIAKWPMQLAYADFACAAIITFIWLLMYRNDPFIWVCLAAGAFGAVSPDLVLVSFIHRRLIKYHWFWRLDYLHHWIHAPVMKRQDRWIGLVIQVVLFILFAWWAWTVRPPV